MIKYCLTNRRSSADSHLQSEKEAIYTHIMKYRIIESQRSRSISNEVARNIGIFRQNVYQSDLEKLVFWLRYGIVKPKNLQKIWHSLADVARLVGVPLGRVKKILSDSKRKSKHNPSHLFH